MAAKTLIDRLRNALRAFRTARGGNVVFTFALATVPIIGFVGAAVDYSRANSAKAAMQAAVEFDGPDALEGRADADHRPVESEGHRLFPGPVQPYRRQQHRHHRRPSPAPRRADFKLDVTGTGQVADHLHQGVRADKLSTSTSAREVLWGIKKLELALALDNTGSMASSSKMTELKTAAHNLLDTLQTAAKTAGRRQGRDHPVRHHGQYRHQLQGRAVVRHRQHRLQRLGIGQRLQQQQLEELLGGLRPRPRPSPTTSQDTSPSTSNSNTLYPVYDCGTLTRIMPLSYDWTALNNKVDAMQPNGNTNVTIGLVWAWHALTSNTPLTEAAAACARSRQGDHPADRRRQYRSRGTIPTTPRSPASRRSMDAPPRPAPTSRPPTSRSIRCG